MFKLKIVTPEGLYQNVEVDSITIPTPDGQRTVLKDHMAIVVPVEIGAMFLRSKGQKDNYFVNEGIFTFEKNNATLIIGSIERESDIDFKRAEEARVRAEERIQKAKDYDESIDLRRAQLALMRSLSRLRFKK